MLYHLVPLISVSDALRYFAIVVGSYRVFDKFVFEMGNGRCT